MWMLSDAHGHVGDEAERQERRQSGILSLICASTPSEAEQLFCHCLEPESESCLVPACGIHPWYADRYDLKDMKPWILRCPAVGEIGMDCVWCRVPLNIQEQKFRQQLELAAETGKPVILHTKGQEKEVADAIRQYPNRYLVHWYSCERHLEDYLDLDCWFSVGPDVWWNRAVQRVAETVPIDRLLVETDGLGAVKWAWEQGRKQLGQRRDGLSGSRRDRKEGGFVPDGEAVETETAQPGKKPENSVSASLSHTLKSVADIRGIDPETAGRRFRDNLVLGFLRGRDCRSLIIRSPRAPLAGHEYL